MAQSAVADQRAQDGPDVEPCLGLACAAPGAQNDVPEARGPATWVAGPRALEQATRAGFYEYRSGTSGGPRAIAYVSPPGQLDQMPASVRNLPLVKQIETETTSFRDYTVAILDEHIFTWAPVQSTATAAKKGRVRARAAANDAYGCPDLIFCLYDQDNWQPPGIGLSSGYNGAGWVSLSGCCGWNDRANSVRNRRNNDSLLNKNWPATNGSTDRYCADSHSSDSDLTNNFGGPPFPGANGGDNEASAFANVTDDAHC